MRNLEKKGALQEQARKQLGDTLIIRHMDISVDDSVKTVVDEVLANEGKIDVLSK